MNQLTHDTATPPAHGTIRTCTAETACPTVLLGYDDGHAALLLAEHQLTQHGIPLPKEYL